MGSSLSALDPAESKGFERSRFERSLHPDSISDPAQVELFPALPWPIRLEVYPQLASTNATLQTRLEAGAPAGSCILALSQTAGKGQRGRLWHSEPGGLYLSLGLRPKLAATQGYRLTLGSAWGIATVLRAQGIPAQIKWPNDLILHNKKLGGILTESRIQGGLIQQVVIGVGINWQNPVPPWGIALGAALHAAKGAADAATHSTNRWPRDRSVLAKPGGPGIESLEQLAACVVRGLILGYHTGCVAPLPESALIERYDRFLWKRGQTVAIAGQTGTLLGIATTGELKVSMNGETMTFPPGTINLGYD